MGLRLDSRVGSVELEPAFLSFGIRPELTKLEFGDVAWEGKGPKGKTVSVGVERKRIDDLLQSMQSHRLSGHQLPGMAELYDYVYLIVEGMWRPSGDGATIQVLIGRDNWVERRISAAAINNYLMSLSLHTGLIAWRTSTDRETALFVIHQYQMWTGKDWEDHKSHEAVYAPADAGIGGRKFTLKPRKVPLAEKIAMQLPRVDKSARHIASHFGGSTKRMVMASQEEWAGILLPQKGKDKGRRLGDKVAGEIVGAIRG